MEPLDNFMENIYNKLVPHIYVPEPTVMGTILKTIEANGAVHYIPKIWSDMKMFDHTDRENLINAVLNVLVNDMAPAGSELAERFANIAWDVWEKIENQSEKRFQKLRLVKMNIPKLF